jgi:uridylate kinase
MTETSSYKRILLKVSGELLSPSDNLQNPLYDLAASLKNLSQIGTEIAIVIGGGNIFRGRDAEKMCMDRTQADHAGLLATMINGIFLKQALENLDIETKVLSSVHIPQVFETYNPLIGQKYLQEKKILIFVAGLGNTYFSTDSAAVVKALEIKAEVLLKATKVDGVYDKDPREKLAQKFSQVSCSKILADRLHCMDMTAAALAREQGLPIIVFDLFEKESLQKVVEKKPVGTYVEGV